METQYTNKLESMAKELKTKTRELEVSRRLAEQVPSLANSVTFVIEYVHVVQLLS